jgi:hypothetical protein
MGTQVDRGCVYRADVVDGLRLLAPPVSKRGWKNCPGLLAESRSVVPAALTQGKGMEPIENRRGRECNEPLWQKKLHRLVAAWKRTSIVRGILVSGFLLAIIGSIVCHSVRLPRIPFILSAIVVAFAWVSLEFLWKCLFAYYVGAAQAEWMTARRKWVKACSAGDNVDAQIVNLRAVLQDFLADKTGAWVSSLQETVSSLSGKMNSISGPIQVLLSNVDELFTKLDDEISRGPFSTVGRPTLQKIASKWQRFGLILPSRIRREAFEPAFNEMLQRCIPAWRFVGEEGRGWLIIGFTTLSIFILLDCIRVMLISRGVAVLLDLLPESLRAWWRRQ